MASELTPDAIARICEHMNDDHADSLALYAKVFGKCERVVSARLRALDAQGMDLDVDTGDGERAARIPFERPVRDAEDAREILVAMARRAALA